MNKEGDFSQGSVLKHILHLALPILLAEMVHVTYSIVDRIFIGHISDIGTFALSGVGVVFPLITFINAFASLVSNGGAPLCSIKRGEKNNREAVLILENSFSLLLIIGIICILALYPTMKWSLRLMGADNNTFQYAKEYFSIYLCGVVFSLISLGANSFITLQGKPVIGMLTVLIGAVTNIILDPIFIFLLDWGVKGAALATVLSQFISATWVTMFLIHSTAEIRITTIRFDIDVIKKILKLGVSGFMFKMTNTVALGVSNMMLGIFGGQDKALYIGAFSIINSLREVYSLSNTALCQGFQPVASFNYGAKKYARVRATIRVFFFLLSFCASISWLLLMLFPSFFVSLFTPDEMLVSKTIPCLRIFFAFFFLISCQTCGQNTFVAMNCPSWSVFFSIFRKLILIVPLTLILPRVGLGVYGVFYAEMISQIIGGCSCMTTMCIVIYRVLRRTDDGDQIRFKTLKLKH